MGIRMAGIAKEVKAEILSKVKAGEKVAKLAEQYGVSEVTIYAWLKSRVEGSVSILEHRKLKKENGQLKEIIGVLTLELEKTKKNKRDLFQLVREKLPHLPNVLIATVFGFVRSSAYYEVRQKAKDALLAEQIRSCIEENKAYGYRRVAIALGVGKKKVQRVMALYKIRPYKRKARWRKRRDEQRRPAPYQNQIKNTCPVVPTQVWFGTIGNWFLIWLENGAGFLLSSRLFLHLDFLLYGFKPYFFIQRRIRFLPTPSSMASRR